MGTEREGVMPWLAGAASGGPGLGERGGSAHLGGRRGHKTRLVAVRSMAASAGRARSLVFERSGAAVHARVSGSSCEGGDLPDAG